LLASELKYTKVVTYMRTFLDDCSPSDLETALQLVYQLFTANVEPREEEVKIVMQMAEQAIYAQERDPYTAFANRAREINYGNSYFFKVVNWVNVNHFQCLFISHPRNLLGFYIAANQN
jgi:hypothetical protein